MTLDWSKATKGAKVKFRCGGEMIIDSLVHHPSDDTRQIYGPDNIYAGWYNNDGQLRSDVESLLDIIEIIPAPEPRTFEFWVNVYMNSKGIIYLGDADHKTREEADNAAYGCVEPKRISCRHIAGKEGDGL